jgi:GNAT superfamily N-acetyltransferase
VGNGIASRNGDHPLELTAKPTTVEIIKPWRDLYRQEMNCQIVHDSLHARQDWTQPYLLLEGGATVGYGSVAVGGPWKGKGKDALFEFYVLPNSRSRVFDLFETLLSSCGASFIETQTNDPLLTVMLHAFAHAIVSESILFHDKLTTTHLPLGPTFRRATVEDADRTTSLPPESLGEWVLELEGTIAATGGILFHYNRPYGDIFMEVAGPFRRRGLGAYLVQELKRVCYSQGSIPSARCNPANVASRKTLQKAGFVPCGHIQSGSVSRSTSA